MLPDGCPYLLAPCCHILQPLTALTLQVAFVQAIYPISTTSEGSYRDPVIVDIINNHNSIAFGS